MFKEIVMDNVALIVGTFCICAGGYLMGIDQEEARWVDACQYSNVVSTHKNGQGENVAKNDKLLQMCVEKSK